MNRYHVPVLLKEVIEILRPSEGGVYADLTFGEGGHSEAILTHSVNHLVAIDRDLEAITSYRGDGAHKSDPRLELHHAPFSSFSNIVGQRQFNGIIADLGVSTGQLLKPERGFSFVEGPIDMRMNQSEGLTLNEILQRISVEELAAQLRRNADLRGAGRLADRILWLAQSQRLASTTDLAKVAGPKRGRAHPATPLFMALRMMVNDELGEIERGLPLAFDRLKPGGRLAVITFHSTEDRLVKRIFKGIAGMCVCDAPICVCERKKRGTLVVKKTISASPLELKQNPRSRSAKLRCIEKDFGSV